MTVVMYSVAYLGHRQGGAGVLTLLNEDDGQREMVIPTHVTTRDNPAIWQGSFTLNGDMPLG